MENKTHGNTGRKHTEEAKKRMGDARRGSKHSKLTKERIRQALAGKSRPYMVGRKHTEDTKNKISVALIGKPKPSLRGRKLSDETRRKMSAAQKGLPRPHLVGNSWNKGRKSPISGSKHPRWKGNDISYRGLHRWVSDNKGKAHVCEFCGKTKSVGGRGVHWANKSGKYSRDLSDWISLCSVCHKAYDRGREVV